MKRCQLFQSMRADRQKYVKGEYVFFPRLLYLPFDQNKKKNKLHLYYLFVHFVTPICINNKKEEDHKPNTCP